MDSGGHRGTRTAQSAYHAGRNPGALESEERRDADGHGVYTEAELRSRYEIMLENYCKTVCIEAQTMSDMARKQILPAAARYAADVARLPPTKNP